MFNAFCFNSVHIRSKFTKAFNNEERSWNNNKQSEWSAGKSLVQQQWHHCFFFLLFQRSTYFLFTWLQTLASQYPSKHELYWRKREGNTKGLVKIFPTQDFKIQIILPWRIACMAFLFFCFLFFLLVTSSNRTNVSIAKRMIEKINKLHTVLILYQNI